VCVCVYLHACSCACESECACMCVLVCEDYQSAHVCEHTHLHTHVQATLKRTKTDMQTTVSTSSTTLHWCSRLSGFTGITLYSGLHSHDQECISAANNSKHRFCGLEPLAKARSHNTRGGALRPKMVRFLHAPRVWAP